MKKTFNYEAAIFSQRYKNAVYEEVIKAIEKSASECGTSRSDIAKKLGFSKAHISRLLSGPSNWTLDTISNLLFAVDAEMVNQVSFFSDCPKENHFHPMGEKVTSFQSSYSLPRAYSKRETTLNNNVPTKMWEYKELAPCP